MHVGVAFDSKLAFNIHIEQKIKNCNEIIGLIRKISVSLQIKAFLTIYKSFVRPHLDDGDVLYDKPHNQNFENKLEKVQYEVCLAKTRAMQDTSRRYKELGLISLSKRCWYNKLIFFLNIVNGLPPDYLQCYIKASSQDNYPLRSVSARKLKPLLSRSESFRKAFFPYCIAEWNKVNPKIRNTKSIHKFKK